MENQNQVPPTTPQPEQPQGGPSAANNDKTLVIVGYIIPLLFFLNMNKGPDERIHANQQLLLLLTWIIGSILYMVLIGIFVHLFALILMIIGIVNAVNGKAKPLPLIGGIKLIK